jgi:NAD(P)-dependent dehydrogenase (short-subunit alcohol dehydrogenase family)
LAGFRLDGRTAIVTGASSGLGVRFAQVLHAVGADVVLAARRADRLRAVAETMPGSVVVVTDVADAEQRDELVDVAVATFGRVDVLVNNAALYNDTRLTVADYDTQVAEFHRALGACVTGAYHCTAAFLPGLRAAGGGNIVNMLTDHVLPGYLITGYAATGYDVAKFGLWRLTESWAVELAPLGIRVNGLSFGATDTPMLRGVSIEHAEKGMKPSDVAQAVLNVLAHGPGGPTGQMYVFGMTRASRQEHLAGIAAIAPPA